MISKIRKLSIEQWADEVTSEFAQLPINPIAIAKSRDIAVQPWTPKQKGVSGYLMKVGDSFGIGYSDFVQNPGFINFTVGHELGHYFIQGHPEQLFSTGATVHYSESGFVSGLDVEKEADLFAATLLMPSKLLRNAVNTSGSGLSAVEKLSQLCVTSLSATAIRLADFSENPMAVIVSGDGIVSFACLSPSLRERQGLTWLKRGDPVPMDSATARFQKNSSSISNLGRQQSTSMLDDWFDGAPRIEMNEDVIGLGNYGKTLTVLFTDEEIDEEDEDVEEWKPRFQRR